MVVAVVVVAVRMFLLVHYGCCVDGAGAGAAGAAGANGTASAGTTGADTGGWGIEEEELVGYKIQSCLDISHSLNAVTVYLGSTNS